MLAELVKAVEHLLYTHDCVIVPDFGGFVGEYQSATIHPVTHRMRPPSKRIRFNDKLIFNDGLLAHEVMRLKDVSYDEALEWIREGVEVLKNRLQSGDKIQWAQMGSMRANDEGVAVFEAHPHGQVSSESYGLAEMRHPAVIRHDQPTEKSIEVPVVPMETRESSRPNWKVAAVLVPAIGMAVSGYFFRSPIQEAGLGVYEALWPKPTSVFESMPRIVSHYAIDWENRSDFSLLKPTCGIEAELETHDAADETIAANTSENQATKLVVTEENRSVEPEVVTPASSAPVPVKSAAYEVVAGCFSYKANADQLVLDLQGQGYAEARLAGQRPSGLWMVSYLACSTREEALEVLRSVRNADNKAAWLLKK